MSRDKFRDNDDVRDPLEGDAKTGGSSDTRSEARGGARENIGNHSRGTAANESGAKENDKTRHRDDRTDEFDATLRREG